MKNGKKIMDYNKIYLQLIERAKTRKIEGYTERHHIIPRCINGDDSEENLVTLTAREHFIAHLILCKIYPNHKGLRSALWMMSNVKGKNQERYLPNSRLYEMIRIEYSELIKGVNNPNYNKKHSEDAKDKMSKKAKERIGEKNGFYAKNHSLETREKIKNTLTGFKHSGETIKKMSENRKGKVSGRKGKINSEEHNRKASESLKKAWEIRKLKKLEE
jgi:hypothetical protein